MKKWKSIFFGFIGFFLISTFNVSIAVLVYSSIDSKKDWQIALFLLFVILLNTILCIFIEQLRRKYATEKPLKEILQATKQMAHGNFNIQLTYRHNYDDFDEFDYIKSDLNHMAEELSKNEILKTDFIANLSHEFKTPLIVL